MTNDIEVELELAKTKIKELTEKIAELTPKTPPLEKELAEIKALFRPLMEKVNDRGNILEVALELQKIKDVLFDETPTGKQVLSKFAKRRLPQYRSLDKFGIHR